MAMTMTIIQIVKRSALWVADKADVINPIVSLHRIYRLESFIVMVVMILLAERVSQNSERVKMCFHPPLNSKVKAKGDKLSRNSTLRKL